MLIDAHIAASNDLACFRVPNEIACAVTIVPDHVSLKTWVFERSGAIVLRQHECEGHCTKYFQIAFCTCAFPVRIMRDAATACRKRLIVLYAGCVRRSQPELIGKPRFEKVATRFSFDHSDDVLGLAVLKFRVRARKRLANVIFATICRELSEPFATTVAATQPNLEPSSAATRAGPNRSMLRRVPGMPGSRLDCASDAL